MRKMMEAEARRRVDIVARDAELGCQEATTAAAAAGSIPVAGRSRAAAGSGGIRVDSGSKYDNSALIIVIHSNAVLRGDRQSRSCCRGRKLEEWEYTPVCTRARWRWSSAKRRAKS
jgi:hypothetical protein